MLNHIRKYEKTLSVLFIYIMFASQIVTYSHGRTYDSNLNFARSYSENNTLEDTFYEENKKNELENYSPKTTQATLLSAGGPGQSENSGFTASSTDGMVNKFTGDFNYSIPLMDVEGFPISIGYSSNIQMNSEASWVGLGWDLSLGAVNRDMRGVPDEANGQDKITRTFSQRDQKVEDGKKNGFYAGGSYSFNSYAPSAQVTFLWGDYTDSYLGFGTTFDFKVQGKFTLNTPLSDNVKLLGIGGNFGYSKDSKRGVGINKGFSLSNSDGDENDQNVSFGSSFHSRAGLMQRYVGFSASSEDQIGEGIAFGGNVMSIQYGSHTAMPKVNFSSRSISRQRSKDFFAGTSFSAFTARAGYINQKYSSSTELILKEDNTISQPMYGYLHSGKRSSATETETELPVMDFERSDDFGFSEEMRNLPFSMQTYDFFNVSAMGLGGVFRAGRTDVGTYYDPTVTSVTNEFNLDDNLSPDADIPAVLQAVLDELEDNVTTLDFGAGAIFSPGPPTIKADVSVELGRNSGKISSGDWSNPFEFSAATNWAAEANKYDPTIFFKAVGELTPNNLVPTNPLIQSAFNTLHEKSPIAMDLKKSGKNIDMLNTAKDMSGNSVSISSPLINASNFDKIPVQAIHFDPITVSESGSGATYQSYVNQGFLYSVPINRASAVRKQNHISQIKMVNEGGMKYTFGIPVYNLEKSEVSFNSGKSDDLSVSLGPLPADPLHPNEQYVYFTHGVDNSPSNKRGRMQMYDKTTMPAYPHSFLLTEMVSSDYVDRNQDGPTSDDIGNFYKLNYTRFFDDGNDPNAAGTYKWRYPVSGGTQTPALDPAKAMQNRGLIASTLDDVAHYSYGEKEVYYNHSVESKNFIAFFYTSDRKDGYSVTTEKGILSNTESLQKLDSIVLYSRNDFLKRGEIYEPTPLQTVIFEYGYELCKGAPNNKHSYSSIGWIPGATESGKLTLLKIRTKSGNSNEMGLSSFTFDYNTGVNFSYSATDPWGNYKNVGATVFENDIYPYADQNGNNNVYHSAWRLKKITNPSGGEIEVDYEADTYGFVQNKRAMRHFKMSGMTNVFSLLKAISTNSSISPSPDFINSNINSSSPMFNVSNGYSVGFTNKLFDGNLKYGSSTSGRGRIKEDYVPNHVLIFPLDAAINGMSYTDANHKVVKDYFTDHLTNQPITEIYLKMSTIIKGSERELVPMYLKIAPSRTNIFNNETTFADDLPSFGVLPSNGSYMYGYVVLETIDNGERKTDHGKDKEHMMIHPAQYYALNYFRQNLPELIYQSCATCVPDPSVGEMDKKVALGNEINKYMIDHNFVPGIQSTYSRIRLYEPDNIKLGGNGRVKRITYKDNWEPISGEFNSFYQWDYKYTSGEFDVNNCGVASFEPLTVMDENPFYTWETFAKIAKKFPDQTMFNTTPLSKQLYPSGMVGYQKVEVLFNNSQENGRTETVFHTAKSHPLKEYKTALNRNAESISPKISLTAAFFSRAHKKYGRSQGFTVETNNFHGKIKSATTYTKGSISMPSVPISISEYHYKGMNDPVKMMNREKVISEENIAVEFDIHSDSRFILEKNDFIIGGARLRLKWVIPNPVPVPGVKVTVPKYQDMTSGFFTNTIVKHLNYSAVVEEVVTTYLGSVNIAENSLYDYYSGQIIASSLRDEFDDKLYNMSFPSHWLENNLREIPRYREIMVNGNLTNASGISKFISSSDLTDNFAEGDIVELGSGTSFTKYQLYSVSPNEAIIMNLNGDLSIVATFATQMRLIESNRKNRLIESMQSFTTKSPLMFGTGTFAYPENEIISSSAISYKYKNGIRCGLPFPGSLSAEVEPGQIYNPFRYGLRGDLVLDGQYAFQGERKSGHGHNVRFDGSYDASNGGVDPFHLYYDYSNSLGWHKSTQPNINKWRLMGETEHYDEFGNVIEVTDQIDVPSSVLYGYSDSYKALPIGQAVNARKSQIAFDGFEDYDVSLGSLWINEGHFDFKNTLTPNQVEIVQGVRHSGHSSLEVQSGYSAVASRKTPYVCDPLTVSSANQISSSSTTLNSCSCMPTFLPTEGEYLVSLWVKYDVNNSSEPTVDIISNELNSSNAVINSNTVTLSPSGPIIDGWRKIEGEFYVIPNANEIIVQMNASADAVSYFDDIRIHPFLSGMTTVVYDDKTLLPMATHDGYNFTTFYNYDENLNLVRVRVETIKGIKTISESEYGSLKDFKQ